MKEFLAVGVSASLLVLTFLLCPFNLLPLDLPFFDPRGPLATSIAFTEVSANPLQAAQSSSPDTRGSTEQGIPLPQIADRAEELDKLLQTINGQLELKTELFELKQRADIQEGEIHRRKRQTEELLAGTPTPMELEDEQRYWHLRTEDLTAQRKLLSSLAGQLGNQTQILDGQLPDWQATWNQTYTLTAVGSVTNRVREELDAIQTTKSKVQEQLNLALTVQNQLSEQSQQIADALLRIREVRERERSRLFEADGLPFWKGGNTQPGQTVGSLSIRSFARSIAMAKDFLKTHKHNLLIFLGAYFLVLFGVLKLRQHAPNWKLPEVPPEAIQLLNRPFSVALLMVLLGAGGYISTTPVSIAFTFYLLYLIPVLRLLAPMIEPKNRVLLNVLVLFYVLEGLHQFVQLPAPIGRGIYALLIIGALIGFGWITCEYWTRQQTVSTRSRLISVVAIRAYLLLLAASLFTNIIGYVSLSEILGMAALASPFVAVALYCGARVLILLWNTILCSRWARGLFDQQVAALKRWGVRFIAVGAALLWLRALLHLLTIRETVVDFVSNSLRRTIGFEGFSFTLGGVLSVLAILLVGYCLANVLSFFLRKFFTNQLPLQRGLPYAISTVTYYICLLLVGVAALSASGAELNKFTLLTGALGVGLGFGLQSIVSNFFSGLILLFERPIHVGDVVEVGGFIGAVRRIGARSCTVLTYQGAEVIVPNSSLLSNNVINWTLSSPWRRVDVPVRVAYGTNPEQVIELLEGVARSHRGVLLERPPEVFFLGFGESALNFELRFWCGSQDTWFQLQSDMTIAVAAALRQAGIEIPFPQRELHIRGIDTEKTDASTRDNESASTVVTTHVRGNRK